MNRWLLGIALALTAWLAYQLQQPAEPQAVLAEGETIELPELRAVPRDEFPPLESFSAMTERPLFSPDRSPSAEVEGEAVVSTRRASNDPDSIDSVVLSGVSIVDGRKLALLFDDDSGEFVRLAEGEQLGGWQVESIEPSSVSLINDQQESYQLELRPPYPAATPANGPSTDEALEADEDAAPIDLRALLEAEEQLEDENDD